MRRQICTYRTKTAKSISLPSLFGGWILKKNHKLYDIYIFYLSDYLTLYNRLSFIKHTLQLAQVHSFLCLSNVPLYICTTTSLSIHLYGGMAGREAQQGGDIYIIMTGLHWCIPQHCKAIILQLKKMHSLLSLLDTISTQHRLVKVGEKGNGPFQGKVSAGRTVSDLAMSESLTGRSGKLPSAPSGPLAASLWNHSQQHGVCSSSQEPSGGWILFNLLFHCLCSPLERDFFSPSSICPGSK